MRGVAAISLLLGCYSPQPPAGAPCPDGVCPSGLACAPVTQTCELPGTSRDATPADGELADAAGDAAPDAVAVTYQYRRRITIANNASSTLPVGFTIRVPIDLASLLAQNKVETDFSDLRVIGDDPIGERDRIVDPPSGPAPSAVTFSLELPLAAGATTTAYSLYYGYAAAGTAPANGTAVFAVYDPFNGNSVASTWMKNDAPSVTAGHLVLRANQTDAIATLAATDNVPIISEVELVATILDPTSDPTVQTDGTFYYWFGYQRTGDFNATDPWSVWIARGKGQVRGEQKSPVGCETGCNGADVTQNTSAHHYAIQRDPAQTRFYRDGTLSYTATVTNNADYSLMIRNYMAASEVHVDWIRARARVSPDPTVTLATEENL